MYVCVLFVVSSLPFSAFHTFVAYCVVKNLQEWRWWRYVDQNKLCKYLPMWFSNPKYDFEHLFTFEIAQNNTLAPWHRSLFTRNRMWHTLLSLSFTRRFNPVTYTIIQINIIKRDVVWLSMRQSSIKTN